MPESETSNGNGEGRGTRNEELPFFPAHDERGTGTSSSPADVVPLPDDEAVAFLVPSSR